MPSKFRNSGERLSASQLSGAAFEKERAEGQQKVDHASIPNLPRDRENRSRIMRLLDAVMEKK